MDRRRFVATTLTGLSSVLVVRRAGAVQEAAAQADAAALPTRTLGKAGAKVTVVGAGTGMSATNRQSNMTRMGREAFEAVLKHEYESGIRYFDCADSYGSHPYVARALKEYPREDYVLSTKMWVMPGGLPEPERPDADVVIDRFRRELDTDYLDLVLIHCMFDPQWPTSQQRQMDIMADLKAKGIIRAHGVSVHSLPALEACVDCDWVDSVHARINPYGDSMDDPDPEKVAAVLRRIHDAGKGVVGMKLVGEGRYRNDPEKRDASIAYALDLGCVDTMIVGFERPAEVDDFLTRVKAALATREPVE
jgi:aryl-alcohol dehydrogenase-like predicted oxidoreductase